jgi:tetratricopeptide (TPR) repeat protein
MAKDTRNSGETRNTISGGTFFGPVFQGRDFTIHLAATPPVALAQLPSAVARFTGRDGELDTLIWMLDPAAAAGSVVVSAVSGLAGVGKTELAVQAGHATRKRGWFPGGALFIDLHGYDETPVEPGQALDALLRALGIAAEHIPPGVEERAALYRSVLAGLSAPVLVIADNASSEAQVRPLFPGAGGHRVVVTSRRILGGLPARQLDLTVLGTAAGMQLLDTALRAARPHDDRITGDQQAAVRLAEVCGGLPLALRIAAAQLKADPGRSARELAGELTDERGWFRRGGLRYDDGSGAASLPEEAAFTLAYRRLDETSARVFRALAVNPGPDVATAAAAILADLPIRQVREVLAGLASIDLIEAAPGAGRWRMHDLLRMYASQLADTHAGPDDREHTLDRLLGFYRRTAGAASDHLHALPGMTVPGEFTGRADALAWFDAERPNLVAAVSLAAATGRDQIAFGLATGLVWFFDWRRHFDDWLATGTIAVDAARRLGDREREAIALNNLGIPLRRVRRFEQAITVYRDALAIDRETGNREAEGSALNNLGTALREVRRFEEAITVCQDALAISRETGDQEDEGSALGNLGFVLLEVRRFGEAITACQEAVSVFRETGDRHHEGMALDNLSIALRLMRRPEEAITACQESLAICRETGDRHGEGVTLNNLGATLLDARRFGEVITVCQDAVAIFWETGDRHGEGVALNNLGAALQAVRRFGEAITAHQDAVAIFRETGDRRREGIALTNLENSRAAQTI